MTIYGCGIALAVLCGLVVGCAVLIRQGHTLEHVLPLPLLVIPSVFLFSRLVYLLANCTYYLTTLSSLTPALYFWDGGYSMCGGILGAYLAACLYATISHTAKHEILDAISLGMPLALCIARLFECGTGLGDGRFGDPILGFFPADDVQPVWLYEAVLALVLFLVLLFSPLKQHRFTGFLTLYGLSQTYMESLRDDGHMVVHFVRIQQVLCLLAALIVLVYALRLLARQGKTKKTWCLGLIAIVCIALAVFSEFGVDRWGSKPLAYGIMLLTLFVLGTITMHTMMRSHRS